MIVAVQPGFRRMLGGGVNIVDTWLQRNHVVHDDQTVCYKVPLLSISLLGSSLHHAAHHSKFADREQTTRDILLPIHSSRKPHFAYY